MIFLAPDLNSVRKQVEDFWNLENSVTIYALVNFILVIVAYISLVFFGLCRITKLHCFDVFNLNVSDIFDLLVHVATIPIHT